VGVEAVIDKDFASALLASDLEADALLIATDVDAVYAGWGTPDQKAIRRFSPDAIADLEFATGSMGPKVRAACEFASTPGRFAAIGTLADVERMLQQEAGTIVSSDTEGIEYASPVGSASGTS
jgi:carbamate kinase